MTDRATPGARARISKKREAEQTAPARDNDTRTE